MRSATQAPVMAAVRVPPSAWMHVAVELDLVLAKRLKVGDGPQGASNQSLDFQRPARLALPRGCLTVACVLWVERGSMPYSAVTQPRPGVAKEGGHPVLDRGGAQNMRVAEFGKAGALGVKRDSLFE